MSFAKVALTIPEILLPKTDIDLHKWSVVACDQYTSQPDYWQQVAEISQGSPTTLNTIFPEVYLEDDDGEQRIKNINQTMQDYLQQGILQPMQKPGFILIDRKTSQAPSRKGLMVAIDLEDYDYNKGSTSLIRATEGTIVDRLPPRIKVRKDAAIELPHIMVLIDDPENTVIEPLFEQNPEVLYDFELMMESGHIKGYRIDQQEQLDQIAQALTHLADPKVFAEKYNAPDQDVLLYAMGDGNHSLATAKAIWEQLKEDADDKQAIMNNPARYALVELVNIHDQGLQFEPIHRVVFDIDAATLLTAMGAHFGDNCQIVRCTDEADMQQQASAAKQGDNHVVPFIDPDGFGVITINNPQFTLELATIQTFLDDYLEKNGGKVDYIHGDDVVNELGQKTGNMGFFFPPISKSGLFKTIIFDGALPRKTFSMGEADEKRFYLEARKIK